MTFEEYAATITWRTVAERTKAKAVWEAAYRQGYKDGQYREGYKNGHAAVKQMEGE